MLYELGQENIMFSWFYSLFEKKTYVYLVTHYELMSGRSTLTVMFSGKKVKKKSLPQNNYFYYNYYYTKEIRLIYVYKGETNYED